MLLVVGALVLASRPAAGGVRIHTLTGETAQGAGIVMQLQGREVESFRLSPVRVPCGGGRTITWSPAVDQGNVRRTQTFTTLTIHEWPDPRFPQQPGLRQNAWMHARISWDGRRIEGTIDYYETGPGGACGSGPIPFSAAR
jgi:hypothetical protein